MFFAPYRYGSELEQPLVICAGTTASWHQSLVSSPNRRVMCHAERARPGWCLTAVVCMYIPAYPAFPVITVNPGRPLPPNCAYRRVDRAFFPVRLSSLIDGVKHP